LDEKVAKLALPRKDHDPSIFRSAEKAGRVFQNNPALGAMLIIIIGKR
jgi:hypothetical protein